MLDAEKRNPEEALYCMGCGASIHQTQKGLMYYYCPLWSSSTFRIRITHSVVKKETGDRRHARLNRQKLLTVRLLWSMPMIMFWTKSFDELELEIKNRFILFLWRSINEAN